MRKAFSLDLFELGKPFYMNSAIRLLRVILCEIRNMVSCVTIFQATKYCEVKKQNKKKHLGQGINTSERVLASGLGKSLIFTNYMWSCNETRR